MPSDDDMRLARQFHPSRPHVVRGGDEAAVRARLDQVDLTPAAREALADAAAFAHLPQYARNVENFIGTVKVPLGLAGPLRVNGLHAQGDFYVPLATTEAALVASYSRGAQLLTDSGGCNAALIDEGVSRGPAFAFADIGDALRFAAWIRDQLPALRGIGDATTRHGSLQSLEPTIEGNHVYLAVRYATGEASGQNMVTIATEALCRQAAANSPVPVQYWFVEANYSGDKKASQQSLMRVRGRRVSADAIISAQLVQRLHTTAERLAQYSTVSAVGAALSGTIGIHGHYANCLAALYIACGQDPACVAESACGITRFEARVNGDLYASVTLPNIMVGTVGGGTALPSQGACLSILGLPATQAAHAFAEISAALCLAGEISISAAICAGEFTAAHQSLARGAPGSPS